MDTRILKHYRALLEVITIMLVILIVAIVALVLTPGLCKNVHLLSGCGDWEIGLVSFPRFALDARLCREQEYNGQQALRTSFTLKIPYFWVSALWFVAEAFRSCEAYSSGETHYSRGS